MINSAMLFNFEDLRDPSSPEARLLKFQRRAWFGLILFTYAFVLTGSLLPALLGRGRDFLLLEAGFYLIGMIICVIMSSLTAAFIVVRDAPRGETLWRSLKTQALFLLPPLVLCGGYALNIPWQIPLSNAGLIVALLSWNMYYLVRMVRWE